MAKFNTKNLRNVVSLSIRNHAKIGDVKVKSEKVDGDVYQVGVVPIKLKKGFVISSYRIEEFRSLVQKVFGDSMSGRYLIDIEVTSGGINLLVNP